EVLSAPRRPMRLRVDCDAPLDLSAVEPPSAFTTLFGASVDLDGDLLAVGEGQGPGAALSRRDSTRPNGWRPLTFASPAGTGYDMAVALDGERLVVGARGYDKVGIFPPHFTRADEW